MAGRAAAAIAAVLMVAGCGGRPAPAPPAAPRTTPAAAGQPQGVTDAPCPSGHPERGCIYLGTVSDLRDGPLAETGRAIADGQRAFWARVNASGGIGGYDVDVERYREDSGYEARGHRRAFDAIRGRVLALAHSLGVSHTMSLAGDLHADSLAAIALPGSSVWEFSAEVVESGASPCVQVANAVDWAVEQDGPPGLIAAVRSPGGHGEDAVAGARAAARRLGARFTEIETPPGPGQQGPAIERLLAERPGLVVVATGPAELAVLLHETAAGGLDARFVGAAQAWDEELLATPALGALRERYAQALPWAPWAADTPGHRALRAAMGGAPPSEAALAGWVSQYPLRAALEEAARRGRPTRAAVLRALSSLRGVDAEGMLPTEAGDFATAPPGGVFRQSVVASADPAAPTGLRALGDFFTGPTAAALPFDGPCR